MNKIREVSSLLYKFFATDQSYHLKQMPDGTYRKTPGQMSIHLIEQNIEEKGSLASYQKNSDSSVKWICFDFDILKKHLDNNVTYPDAKNELTRTVILFSQILNDFNIPHLIEYSGNRGFHIWITLYESIAYQTTYHAMQAILLKINLQYNENLIGIDLYPKTKSQSDGVGSGVKIPLSLHTKSKKYSILLSKTADIELNHEITLLTSDIIEQQILILNTHQSVNIHFIEKQLDIFLDHSYSENYYQDRIKNITIDKNGFTLDELINHWQQHKPLEILAKKIYKAESISNSIRVLLVGLLGNIHNRNNFGKNILKEIFSSTTNYNAQTTNNALNALISFNFPSQEQIENVTNAKFERKFSLDELISICIPKFVSYEDGIFEFSKQDIAVTALAELNYLFQNDEVQLRLLINKFSHTSNDDLLQQVNNIQRSNKKIKFYSHQRKEPKKTRLLTTLDLTERILTSAIIKQFDYFFQFEPNINSHGYKLNKGFKDGYIFQPWLYSWLEFLSNINSAIDNQCYKNYYIVKTDITSFYDVIPHDNIKRMLLGGLNPSIDKKVYTLQDTQLEKYKKFVEKLIDITAQITKSNLGLPQGPAYARYLAELYLNNIDIKLDNKIKQGELFLYQRYVDDIFFVAESQELAKATLEALSSDLEILGLSINRSKTSIKQIKHFSDDFNQYRSQSKYAVDRISRNFDDATDNQKDLAISEFMKLLHAETCDDDLAFIFSHLSGVSSLDNTKKEKVVQTLMKKNGRGSLYKHLFNFTLDNSEHWHLLNGINEFDALQSEVFTSSMINILESMESLHPDIKQFIFDQIPKLTLTEVVQEHLTYMSIKFNIQIKMEDLPASIILRTLNTVSNEEDLFLSSELIQRINTELNNIKNLPDFIQVLYPLCININTSKIDLNRLAYTYYAKLAFDEKNKLLSIDCPPMITTEDLARKFYYLLCLFSISKANTSTELLKAIWQYCAYIFNNIEMVSNIYLTHNWLKKIHDIEIEPNKALCIISSIVDGNIYRGINDDRKMFDRFHTTIFVFVILEEKLFEMHDIQNALTGLKDKAIFYEWLIDKKDVNIFPTNKQWFEKNIILNNTIILRKNNQLLIRKPTTEFVETEKCKNEHQGYSEIVETFNPTHLQSINEIFENSEVKENFNLLMRSLDENEQNFPNIFTDEKILLQSTLTPFISEFKRSNHLILQYSDSTVSSFENNINNYLNCFFDIITRGKNGTELRGIKEKYFQNLNSNINLLELLKHFTLQLNESNGITTDFYYDVMIASALYTVLENDNPVQKIEKFIDQYHKFNPEKADRHIYAVSSTIKLVDDSPLLLLDSIIHSLSIIPNEIIPSLPLYIFKDIDNIKRTLQKFEDDIKNTFPLIDLTTFKKDDPKISPINNDFKIGGKKYTFNQIKLFNFENDCIQPIEQKHIVQIKSTEHFYYWDTGNNEIYVVVIPVSISKIYISIEERFNTLVSDTNPKSYPPSLPKKPFNESLIHYDDAISKIAIHQDISKIVAKEIIDKWLISLPKKFHQPFVSLIAAHIVMETQEIQHFVESVRSSLAEPHKMNPFLIKKTGDYNGTHRVLYHKGGDIGRKLEDLQPLKIRERAKIATVIVDNILSGSQVVKALKYYLGLKSEYSNYFIYTEEESNTVKKNLMAIQTLNICTILYTEKGITHIQDECKKILNNDVTVNVISGRNINSDAIFATSNHIGSKDKSEILELLTDKNEMNNLCNHLQCSSSSRKQLLSYTQEDFNKTNLVARYKSLPKKCFSFLHMGLKGMPDTHPFYRILEKNE